MNDIYNDPRFIFRPEPYTGPLKKICMWCHSEEHSGKECTERPSELEKEEHDRL